MSDDPHQTAIVSGAGTVGVIAAVTLAQQGWSVQVFEKTSLPNAKHTDGDERAYSLSLTTRGIRAGKLAGVSLNPLAAAQGDRIDIKFYKKNGTAFRSESMHVTEDPGHLRASRTEVTEHVTREAMRLQPAIRFHYDTAITEVDLAKQCIYILSAGARVQVPYDLLVGADGANSIVGSALQHILPSTFLRRYRHNHMYSTAPITQTHPEGDSPHTMFEAHALLKEGTVARDVRGANRNRVGLILPQPQADAIRNGSPGAFLDYFAGSAPKLPQNARQAIEQLVKSRPQFYPIPNWTYLSQLHGPKTVLLGDAAHTMTPALGQGLNSGLEDVAVFAQCLRDFDGDVDAALPAYNRARLPDIKAIMTINEVVASSDVGVASQDQDLPHKLWIKAHGLLLILHMLSHTLLHKAAPAVFEEPLLMPMAMGTKVMPYRAVLHAWYRDAIMLFATLTLLMWYAVS